MHSTLAHALARASLPIVLADHRVVRVRRLGRTAYARMLARMREFSAARDESTPDEIWLTEHPPVYTLGLAAKRIHLLDAGGIEVQECDRGGQVTYHGPGQAIAYVLIDLHRRGIRVREMVNLIEQALIDTLANFGIAGERRAAMPGVYVGAAKIAALGLKVRNGRCYHGASLNVDLDLAPFAGINPCGYPGLASTSLKEQGSKAGVREAGERVATHLTSLLEHYSVARP